MCDCKASLVYTDAEVFCPSCGFVVKDNLVDTGAETRPFGNENKMRTGPPSIVFGGLSTGTPVFGWKEISKLPFDKRPKFYRMMKLGRMQITSRERNFIIFSRKTKILAEKFSLPPIAVNRILFLYRRCYEKRLTCGKPRDRILEGLVYIVCRELGSPRTLSEIAGTSPEKRKEAGKAYRFLSRKLGIKICPPKPEDFVARFGYMLNLPQNIQTEAVKIIECKIRSITGRSPSGIAAAALFISARNLGSKLTGRQVSEKIGVSEVTLRDLCREIIG